MSKNLTLNNLFADFQLLVILFVAFRVTLFFAYPSLLLTDGEYGIGRGGDRLYHYNLSSLADQELYPFRDWWSEFPPLFYLTTTGIYEFLGEGASYQNWALVMMVIMVLSEVGVLVMVRNIGVRLHGEATGMALAWIYALMAAPTIHMWWNFDSWVAFFTLGAIWLLIRQQHTRSALMVAIGAFTKFISLLLFGVLIRFYSPRRAILSIAIALGAFVIAYLPLFLVNAEFSIISLTSQFGKPSYQTIWALIDQNYTTGNFGSVESHLTAEGVNEGNIGKNEAVIPSIVRLALAGAIGLFVFIQTRRFDQLGVVAFFTITLLIFYLQSQGWSPQWLCLIIPLTLLVVPNRQGALLCVMLSLLAFVEYPFIFIRTAETNGIIDPTNSLFIVWVLVIVMRTLLLALVAYLCYQKLRQQPNPELALGK
jgi:hypothetical protein